MSLEDEKGWADYRFTEDGPKYDPQPFVPSTPREIAEDQGFDPSDYD